MLLKLPRIWVKKLDGASDFKAGIAKVNFFETWKTQGQSPKKQYRIVDQLWFQPFATI